MKTLFYCHHGLGMGHLVRTLELANAMLSTGPVAVVVGGELPEGFPIRSELAVLELPPLRMDTDGGLSPSARRLSLATVMQARIDKAVEFVRTYRPEVLIVEMFPFGRKKLANEIQTLVRAARDHGTKAVFSSVRDILVTNRDDQIAYDRRAADWLNQDFDALLVHGDQRLVALDATFTAMKDITIPVHYTGYVCRWVEGIRSNDCREPRVVVSAGGGRVGKKLVETAAAAQRQLSEFGFEMLILAGPLADNDDQLNGVIPGLTVRRFDPNLPKLLARSWVSISQAGYNTITDLIQTETPAVLVPFETPREDEQLRRARCLQRHGWAEVLRQDELNPAALAGAVSNLGCRQPEARKVNLDGVRNTRGFVTEWCREH